MKAAVIEKYGAIALRETPIPDVGDYDALCELLYGATCSGTDTHLIEGHPPFCNWVKLPFILGHESVGRVMKTGRKHHAGPAGCVSLVRHGQPVSVGSD